MLLNYCFIFLSYFVSQEIIIIPHEKSASMTPNVFNILLQFYGK